MTNEHSEDTDSNGSNDIGSGQNQRSKSSRQPKEPLLRNKSFQITISLVSGLTTTGT